MKFAFKWLAACGLLAVAGSAFAQDPTPDYDGSTGTYDYTVGDRAAADSVVENTATVTYEVGGIEQETESNEVARFRVDRVILINVANTDTDNEVSVTPEETDAYLTFLVRNDSNATLDLLLELDPDTTDFDPGTLEIFVESSVTPNGFQRGGATPDTAITTTSGGAPILASMAQETSKVVYVVGTIPNSNTAEDEESVPVVLLATAYEPGTDGDPLQIINANTNDTLTNEAGSNNDGDNLADTDGAMRLDTVLGDLAGDDGDDIATDGQHSDTGAFVVGTADITVSKASVVLSDPFNGETNPKAIPGAEVLYCITVTNAGGDAADNVSIKDPVPTGTTYVPNSIEVFSDEITCADALVGAGLAITDSDADDATEASGNLADPGVLASISGNSGDTGESEVVGRVVNTTVGTVDANDGADDGVTATIFRVLID